MRLKTLLLLAAVSLFLTSQNLYAIEISGPAKVVDADTIVIGSQVIRLHGIDAPESAQRCSLSGGKSWPCGKVAIEHIKELLTNTTATCSGGVFDDYDRLLATCRNLSGVELNLDLIENGLAWAFIKYSDDLADGRKAFMDEDGIAWTIDGEKVDEALAAGINWEGSPSREGYELLLQKKDDLDDYAHRGRVMADRLGENQNRLEDEDNPPTRNELDDIASEAEDLSNEARDLSEELRLTLSPSASATPEPSMVSADVVPKL